MIRSKPTLWTTYVVSPQRLLLLANGVVIAAVLCVLASIWLESDNAKKLHGSIGSLEAQLLQKTTRVLSGQATLVPPPDSQYMSDVATILDLANTVGIPLGMVTYEVQNAVGSYVLHSMEIRTLEEYPRAKLFAAQVLAAIPNANISGLRIDRKDVSSSVAAITLQFSMVYSASIRSAQSTARGVSQ